MLVERLAAGKHRPGILGPDMIPAASKEMVRPSVVVVHPAIISLQRLNQSRREPGYVARQSVRVSFK